MTRIHGRINEPLEYVELQAVNKRGGRVDFVTQRAGNRWNTYELRKGEGWRVHGLNWRSLKQAEAVIQKAATMFENQ